MHTRYLVPGTLVGRFRVERAFLLPRRKYHAPHDTPHGAVIAEPPHSPLRDAPLYMAARMRQQYAQ